ncbi:MAG: hypothetical protein LBD20_02240 [Spirochaetaceae bacterium]|jgi:hypothetical protein|nr:hypothetical protein [Spirochaetaceae bacterium]
MIEYYDKVLEEVRRNRENLLNVYGGIDGFHEYMRQERPRLEKDGWKFINPDELRERKSHITP